MKIYITESLRMLRYSLDCVRACVFASQVKHTKRAWKAASSRARISAHFGGRGLRNRCIDKKINESVRLDIDDSRWARSDSVFVKDRHSRRFVTGAFFRFTRKINQKSFANTLLSRLINIATFFSPRCCLSRENITQYYTISFLSISRYLCFLKLLRVNIFNAKYFFLPCDIYNRDSSSFTVSLAFVLNPRERY